ncbi:MAG: hypothetical protein JWN19_2587 [Arthrobacter sp.]|nr:hypothetical protein [Arthrobacter sp.]
MRGRRLVYPTIGRAPNRPASPTGKLIFPGREWAKWAYVQQWPPGLDLSGGGGPGGSIGRSREVQVF